VKEDERRPVVGRDYLTAPDRARPRLVAAERSEASEAALGDTFESHQPPSPARAAIGSGFGRCDDSDGAFAGNDLDEAVVGHGVEESADADDTGQP